MRKRLLNTMLILAMALTMINVMGRAAFAADKLLDPTNLTWDGTVAKWDNPNSLEDIQTITVYLYNTKDTLEWAASRGGNKYVTREDFGSSLIPGETYYFEVVFVSTDGLFSEYVKSAEYTVPGIFTVSPVSNLKLKENGDLTWDAANYITHYESTLYVKNESNWDAVASDIWITWDKTSYSWASKMEEGKTYKATLVGIQGSLVVATQTYSNEQSNYKVSTETFDNPTNLKWDGTVAKWDNPNSLEDIQTITVYLYNTKDTSEWSASRGGNKYVTMEDFGSSLIPGETYYFEVVFVSTDGKFSEYVKSAEYTVPGTFTASPVSNLKLKENGDLTWDAANYVTHYESTLYVKNESNWDAVASDTWITWDKTSYSWASKMEEGKHYKATLVAKQGNIVVATETESNIYPEIKIDIASLPWFEREESYPYTGSAIEPAVWEFLDDIPDGFIRGKAWTSTYSNNTNPGTATLTVTGIGNYTGTKVIKFTIAKEKISIVKLSAYTYTYSGTAKNPGVTVITEHVQTLAKGKTAAYSNENVKIIYPSGRKSVGTYTVKVTGLGGYTGSISKTFKINPKKAVIKSATVGTRKITVKMSTKVASTGGSKYQIKYRQKGTSIWKTINTTYQTKSITNLKKGKKYEIKVRAYKVVNGKTYYGAYSSVKTSAAVK